MLKKAGIVFVGAAAGVLSMTSVAFAGDAQSDNGGNGDNGGDHSHHHHHHHGGDWGHHHGGDWGGPCGGDKTAVNAGDSPVNASNAASNLDLTHVNILSQDDSSDPCHGGPGGPGDGPGGPRDGGDGPGGPGDGGPGGGGPSKTSANFGDSLANLSNLAANPDISHVNVLSTDNS